MKKTTMYKTKSNRLCPDCNKKLLLVIIEDLSMHECPYCKAMYHLRETKENRADGVFR